MPSKILIAVCVVLAAITAYVYWPESRVESGALPALTRKQADEIPDAALVGAVTADVANRMFRGSFDAGAWKALSDPARHVWVTANMEPRLTGNGFLFVLIASSQTGGPGLAEARDAYAAIGAAGLARVIGDAITVDANGGRAAVDGSLDASGSIAHPPGFVDPFAAVDAAFKHELTKSGIDKLRTAYVRQHLDEILAKP